MHILYKKRERQIERETDRQIDKETERKTEGYILCLLWWV